MSYDPEMQVVEKAGQLRDRIEVVLRGSIQYPQRSGFEDMLELLDQFTTSILTVDGYFENGEAKHE